MSEPWVPTLPNGWKLEGEVERDEVQVAPINPLEDFTPVNYTRWLFTISKEIFPKYIPQLQYAMYYLIASVDETGAFGKPAVVIERYQIDSLFKFDTGGKQFIHKPDSEPIPFPCGLGQPGYRATVHLFASDRSPNTAPCRDGNWYPIRDAAGIPPLPTMQIHATLCQMGEPK